MHYAIFHVVIALGYSRDFITSKHSQLLGWFNRTFIYEESVFDKELKNIYKEAYDRRHESDYDYDEPISMEDVNLLFSKAQHFIQTVRAHIESNMETE